MMVYCKTATVLPQLPNLRLPLSLTASVLLPISHVSSFLGVVWSPASENAVCADCSVLSDDG